MSYNMYVFFYPETPAGYISEDGGSPRPVDPNAMDVDTVNSPPAVTPQTGEWVRSLIDVLNQENSFSLAVCYVQRRRLTVQNIVILDLPLLVAVI